MRRFAIILALAGACALAQSPASAAIDIFGRFTGIDGESADKDHKNWIDVLAYSWGASNSGSLGSGGGGGQGKVDFADWSFTKLTDKSSPVLFFDLASGKHIEQALFDVVRAGDKPQTFLQYKFNDVLITSYSVSGASGSDLIENWSMTFAKAEMTYRPQKADGSLDSPITFKWDLKSNDGSISPVPEPSTWAMMLAGLAFVAYRGRKYARARAA